ncbi:thiamin pyrophosphokinase, putative [Eimeria brunetti]|uniref:Thiamin pyrophosphokinase, putative n=1 Tax=Eimeria brunetti TaxID=51314 RepID=U6LJP6_9EIME|nr:thiamin pyrophosphokinase, putative [Eimeria brunetti]
MFLSPRLLLPSQTESFLKAFYSRPHAPLHAQLSVQQRQTVAVADLPISSRAPTASGRLHANRHVLRSYPTEISSRSSSSSSSRSNTSSRPTTVHDLRILERVLSDSNTSAVPTNTDTPAVEAAGTATHASTDASERGRAVLLLLNRPLPSYVNCLLKNAALVVAADGAANHMLPLYLAAETQKQQKQLQKVQEQQQQAQGLEGIPPHLNSGAAMGSGVRTLQLPACICGDLDSCKSEALSFFRTRGVPVVRLPDQSQTDLEKAFAFAANKYHFAPNDTIIITGAIGGRFDHSVAAISFLYKVHNAAVAKLQQPPKVVLLGGYNACFLLVEGDNEVLLSNKIFSQVCGLLPMAGRVRSVTTEGLQWNVRGEPLFVGGLISSSNLVSETIGSPVFMYPRSGLSAFAVEQYLAAGRVKDRIKIATSDPLVFFGELNKESLPP